jgi:hypothetical protein
MQGQMNDASEVLDAVFDAMHKAYTSPLGQEYANSDKEEAKPDGWTCTELRRCIVHDLFGLDVAEEMQCNYCGMVSRKLKYTSYFHNINASALRREKVGLVPFFVECLTSVNFTRSVEERNRSLILC